MGGGAGGETQRRRMKGHPGEMKWRGEASPESLFGACARRREACLCIPVSIFVLSVQAAEMRSHLRTRLWGWMWETRHRACIMFDFDTQCRHGAETREEVKLFIFGVCVLLLGERGGDGRWCRRESEGEAVLASVWKTTQTGIRSLNAQILDRASNCAPIRFYSTLSPEYSEERMIQQSKNSRRKKFMAKLSTIFASKMCRM